MNFQFKTILIAIAIITVTTPQIPATPQSSDVSEELTDFDFDFPEKTNFETDYFYNDEDFDLPSDSPPPTTFREKEMKVRATVLKAWSSKQFKRKLGEIIPILRVLTTSQKVVLASIITAQVSAETSGQALNLNQVTRMFGKSPNLLLPILLDVANLVKKAGSTESQTPSEKEQIPSVQILRRSFQTKKEVPSVSYQKLARLNVDDSNEAKIRNIRDVTPQTRESRVLLINAHAEKRNSRPFTDNDRSYHERKLNMTAFTGVGDQLAMASQQSMQIAKPNSYMPDDKAEDDYADYEKEETLSSYLQKNLTLEQIEALAFATLNETETIPKNPESYQKTATMANATDENLPTPEKLILLRYRPRLSNKISLNRPKLPTSTAFEMSRCEKFANLCINTPEYPMDQIMGSIYRNRHAMTALLAEYRDNFIDKNLNADIEYIKRSDNEIPTPTGMCPSIVRYARPQKARSASGEWKFIVNTGQHTQTLRLEKCSNPQEACTYLTDSFKSRCTQIFNYHRLLSWDKLRGLHVDIFKVPTCCSCHVDGYREAFPPVFGKTDYNSGYKNSLSQLNKYSTIQLNEDDEEDDEDEELDELPSYYSNKYKVKPSQNSFNKYEPSSYLSQSGSSNVHRYERVKTTAKPESPFIPSYHVDSYLSPPSDDEYTLQREPPITTTKKRKRRPTNRREQIVEESEFIPHRIAIDSIELTTSRPKQVRFQTLTPTPHFPQITTLATTTNKPILPTVKVKIKKFNNKNSRIYTRTPPQTLTPKTTSAVTTASTTPTTTTTPSTTTTTTTNTHKQLELNKRVNYNYHPIIDFFEDEDENEEYESTSVRGKIQRMPQRSIGNRIGVQYNNNYNNNRWRPIVQRQRLRTYYRI